MSAIIIIILIGSAQLVCNLSISYGASLGQSTTPFYFADNYIGNLATVQGIALLTSIYTHAVAYQVESFTVTAILNSTATTLGGIIGSLLSGSGQTSSTGLVSATVVLPAIDTAVGGLFTSLATMYIAVFAPLVTLAVGMLFVQYILLTIMQYTAFTVILPAAIFMRSLAFTGTNLRKSANAILALAIAMYLVYPLMIGFDGKLMAYANTQAGMPPLQNINVNSFFTSGSSSLNEAGLVSLSLPDFATPYDIVQLAESFINLIAQFLFQSIVLFAINFAVTMGFATGLARALDSGVEGAGSFWNAI